MARHMWESDFEKDVESYKTEHCSHPNNENKPKTTKSEFWLLFLKHRLKKKKAENKDIQVN